MSTAQPLPQPHTTHTTNNYFPSTSPFTHHKLMDNPLRHSIENVVYPQNPNIIRTSIDDDYDDDSSEDDGYDTSSTTSSDDSDRSDDEILFSPPGNTSAAPEDYIPSPSYEKDAFRFDEMMKKARNSGRKGSTFELAEMCAHHSPRRHSVSFPLSSSTTSLSSSSGGVPTVTEKEKEKVKGSASKWLAKTRQNISYSIVSRETQEAFTEISALFDKMFGDVPYDKIDIMLGLGILNDYYKATHVSSQTLVEDVAFVSEARYYMKFASCCYGWKFIYGILQLRTQKFMSSVISGDAANVKALCDHTGISPSDIMAMKWTSTLYDNGHYVCFCHEKKTIVVALRGSFHVRDALTDLVASNTEFLVGSAHTGFLRTATAKMQKLAPVILKCRAMKPDYKVIFVGHSLGAGVSSLLTLLFHRAYPDIPVHCYAYAVPCIASIELALHEDTQRLIDSFVLDDDVVPRLCFATLAQLKTVVLQILAQSKPGLQRAFHWMSGAMGDSMTSKIASYLKCAPRPEVKSLNNQFMDVSCFPPGRVWHLFPRADHVTLPPLSSSSSYPPASLSSSMSSLPSHSSSAAAASAAAPAAPAAHKVHIPVQAVPSVIPNATPLNIHNPASIYTTTTPMRTSIPNSIPNVVPSSATVYGVSTPTATTTSSSSSATPENNTSRRAQLRASIGAIRMADEPSQKAAVAKSSFLSSWRNSSAPQKSFFPSSSGRRASSSSASSSPSASSSSSRRASSAGISLRPVAVSRGPVGAAPMATGAIPAPPTMKPAEALAERYDLSPVAKRRIAAAASKKLKGFVMEYSNSTLFHEIVISDTMYSNHMPNKYEVALESYMQILTDHHRRNSVF